MSSENLGGTDLAAVILQFKKGALLYHQGCEDEDNSVQDKGVKGTKDAVRILDALGPDGRKALIPLMSDPDPGIRVYAAGYLLKIMPEEAAALLEREQDYGMTRAHMTAFYMLWRHKKGELTL
jgi:hypothetical protein